VLALVQRHQRIPAACRAKIDTALLELGTKNPAHVAAGAGERNLGHRSHPLYRAPGAPATPGSSMKTPPACGVRASSAADRFSRSEVTYSVRPSGPPKHGIVGCVTGNSTYSISSPSRPNRLSRPADTPQFQ